MRIVSIEPVERPVEMSEADEVLPTRLYVFDSGNSCAITRGVKHLAGGQCRIMVNYAWLEPPKDAERDTMEEYVRNMLGMGEPEFLATSLNRAASERVNSDWLGSGKKPLPN